MIRGLYNWTMSLAQSKHALWVLGIVSFFEASVFPIPPDALMIPMVLANPRKAWLIAGITTVGSVAGGALGYMFGAFLYEEFGIRILEAYGKTDAFNDFSGYYNQYGAAILLISGITPVPFKATTILSGATGLNFVTFMVFNLIARGIRFYIVAGLLWKFGPPILEFVEKRLVFVFILGLALLLGGFYVLWLA